jgi:hypothetical protein
MTTTIADPEASTSAARSAATLATKRRAQHPIFLPGQERACGSA